MSEFFENSILNLKAVEFIILVNFLNLKNPVTKTRNKFRMTNTLEPLIGIQLGKIDKILIFKKLCLKKLNYNSVVKGKKRGPKPGSKRKPRDTPPLKRKRGDRYEK
jgi:hypothetical protein